MSGRFPDLEVYVRAPELETLQSSLANQLGVQEWLTHGQQLSGRFEAQDEPAEVVIHDRAFKNYCSVWIKKNVTTWLTDLEFAKWLAGELPYEVRCSQSGWIEGEPTDQPTKWFRLRGADLDEVRWD